MKIIARIKRTLVGWLLGVRLNSARKLLGIKPPSAQAVQEMQDTTTLRVFQYYNTAIKMRMIDKQSEMLRVRTDDPQGSAKLISLQGRIKGLQDALCIVTYLQNFYKTKGGNR